MSYVGFILKAFALSPFVFFRYVPIVAILAFIVYGLFVTTDNPWVVGMILFLVGTVGTTFLFVNGMRAGLMVIRATTPPTAEGLLNVTIKMMFTHMILQLVLVIVLTAGMYWVATTFILSDAAAAAAGTLSSFYSATASFDSEAIELLLPQLQELIENPAPLREAAFVLTTGYYLMLGIGISLMGIPMSAFAANAVQYSPQNDLIFGIGRYFPHQYTVWVLASVVPVALYMRMAPPEIIAGVAESSSLTTLDIAFLVWAIYAPCVSYAAMALGYREIREKVKRWTEAERVPEINYEEERERVRSLRQARRSGASGTVLYDPRKKG
ncbi:hypothetical protein [Oceanibium sediminis]|uniref:hypothetical protein n=1 Tax=Oceanibium sediminis TaxID=2026339 RepID=UPI000DD43B2E|nr:hypothetical protein [Oceanibium sediminis]